MNRDEIEGQEIIIRVERGINGYAVRLYKAPGDSALVHQHIASLIADTPFNLGARIGDEIAARFAVEERA